MIVQTIQWLTIFMTLEWTVDGLIGLRPPSATYEPHHSQLKPHVPARRGTTAAPQMYEESDDIKFFLLQRSRPGHPVSKQALEEFLKSRENKSEDLSGPIKEPLRVTAANCRPSAVLRCSIHFLKSFLRNDSAYCDNVKNLKDCMVPRLEGCDKDGSATAHHILTAMKQNAPSGENCDHTDGKSKALFNEVLSYSPCCVVNLLHCTERTYRELLNNTLSCDVLTNYTSCAAFSFRDYDSKSAEKIFQYILTLTRTCIHVRKPYN